jgi:hypothetical protein
MKRQEELEAALAVISVFAFALLSLLFILRWDNITYCCRKTVRPHVVYQLYHIC